MLPLSPCGAFKFSRRVIAVYVPTPLGLIGIHCYGLAPHSLHFASPRTLSSLFAQAPKSHHKAGQSQGSLRPLTLMLFSTMKFPPLFLGHRRRGSNSKTNPPLLCSPIPLFKIFIFSLQGGVFPLHPKRRRPCSYVPSPRSPCSASRLRARGI